MDAAALLSFCQELVGRAVDAGADEAEVAVCAERQIESTLEGDAIHTVQSHDETVFGLRLLRDGAQGFVTANDIDQRTLGESVGEALDQARLNPPDSFNGLPEPSEYRGIEGLYDEEMSRIGVDDSTRIASTLLERVHQHDRRVRVDSGSVSFSVMTSAIASSKGVALVEDRTNAQGYLFGMAVDGDDIASFDYDGESSCTISDFEAKLLEAADRFSEKCLMGLAASGGESFCGTVLLSPDAVAEFLLPSLTTALCADAVRKGQSPLAGKVGEAIAAPQFTLVDDATLPGQVASSAFDREGVPTRRFVLVKDGILQGYLYNHYEARAAGGGVQSTGHASGGAGSPPGIGPTFLDLAAGEQANEDLVCAGERAVVVNRFSGSTNPVNGDFSGVVKNGFLLSGGERRAIKEVLIAGNLFDALRGVSAGSRERRLIGGTRLVPTLRIEGVSVTAG